MADFFAKDTVDGLGDGSSWANCFGPAELDAWATAAALAADRCFCLSGTYVMPDVNSARDGLAATPVWLVGVRSASPVITYDDWAFGANRPLFQFAGADGLTIDDFWRIHNFEITASAASAVQLGKGTLLENCKVTSAAGGATQAIYLSDFGARAVNCEVTNPGGRAIGTQRECQVIGCRLYNSAVGIVAWNTALTAALNLIDDCTIGIDLTDEPYCAVVNNTLYNGTTGIVATTANCAEIVNNIISGFTVPAEWGTEQLSNHFDWNVWHNNDTPVNVTPGPHAIYQDPQFIDPAAGDFRQRGEIYGLRPPVTVGQVIVGSLHTSLPGAPAAAPSYAGDQLVLDGLESVFLDLHPVDNVYRLQEQVEEMDASQGVYQARNVEFHLPCGPGIYLPGGDPRLGGIIQDTDGVEYRMLAVRQPWQDDYWGVITRSLAISGEYNLDDTVTLWRYVDTTDGFGSKVTTFPIGDPAFTDIACKIQEQPEQLKDHVGLRGFRRRFDVFLELEIDVRYGDRIVDQDGTIYSIAASRNRDSISRYSHIEAIIEPS